MKAWHRRRRVGPQPDCTGQLSRAKTCAGWAPQWPHSNAQSARWINFGSFAKACHGKSFYSGFLFFLEQHEHTSTTVWQKIRSVPHFLEPPAIDKEPESNSKMYVNQRRDEMARTWKHILRHDHFRAKYRYVGVFFERRFQPLSVGRFFSNQRESISRCPKSPFPSKTQNRQIARTSPLRHFLRFFRGCCISANNAFSNSSHSRCRLQKKWVLLPVSKFITDYWERSALI